MAVREKEYEVGVVLKPTLTEEQVEEYLATLKGQIEAAGGHDLTVDKWGKRRLAYEIEHFHEGIYIFLRFHAATDAPERLKHHLLIADPVIRHIIVVAPPKQERAEGAVKPPRAETSFRAPSAVTNAAPEATETTAEAPAEA